MTRIAALTLAAALALGATPAFAQDEADEVEASEPGEGVAGEGAPAEEAADAAEEDLSRARELFGQGVELLGQERWDDAAARFRQVLAVRDTAAVRYNLALALSHTDAIAEAADLADAAMADPEVSASVLEEARTLLAELEPRLGRLTVRVTGGDAATTVEVDGDPLAADQVGRSRRVSAGEHRVVLLQRGEPTAERTVEVAGGANEEVVLVASAVSLEDEHAPLVDTGGGGDVTSEPWFWAVIGGAAAVVVAAVIIGVVVGTDGQVESPVAGTLDPGVITID